MVSAERLGTRSRKSLDLVDARLLGPARRFLEEDASPQEQKDIQRVINSVLRANPNIDHITKTVIELPPAIFVLYDDGQFRIVYHHIHNREIRICNIGRSGDDTPLI